MVASDNVTDPFWGPLAIPNSSASYQDIFLVLRSPVAHPRLPCILSGYSLGVQNLSIYSCVAQPWACNANKAQGWSDQLTLKSLMFWHCGHLRQRSCTEVLRFQVMFLYASLNNCNQRGRVVLHSVSSLWSISWSLHFAL